MFLNKEKKITKFQDYIGKPNSLLKTTEIPYLFCNKLLLQQIYDLLTHCVSSLANNYLLYTERMRDWSESLPLH